MEGALIVYSSVEVIRQRVIVTSESVEFFGSSRKFPHNVSPHQESSHKN